jgi:hypothetical protein
VTNGEWHQSKQPKNTKNGQPHAPNLSLPSGTMAPMGINNPPSSHSTQNLVGHHAKNQAQILLPPNNESHKPQHHIHWQAKCAPWGGWQGKVKWDAALPIYAHLAIFHPCKQWISILSRLQAPLFWIKTSVQNNAYRACTAISVHGSLASMSTQFTWLLAIMHSILAHVLLVTALTQPPTNLKSHNKCNEPSKAPSTLLQTLGLGLGFFSL